MMQKLPRFPLYAISYNVTSDIWIMIGKDALTSIIKMMLG